MRIPFPTRISYSHAFLFASALFCVEWWEGTRLAVCGLIFCYIHVATAAFNIAGGIYYPSGAFIAFNAVITLIIPVVTKAIIGETADKYLIVPLQTFQAYLCAMIALFIGAVISRRYRRRKAWIANMLPPTKVRDAYIGSVIFTVFFSALTAATFTGDGSIGSALNQLNRFPVLAYMLGVIGTIHFSKGRRSVTWPLLTLMVYGASSGLYTFSKEAFLSPFFGWVLGAAYMRYRLAWINIAAVGLGLFVTVTYLVPYAQIGRDIEDPAQANPTYLLSHMDDVRAEYAEKTATTEKFHNYDRSIPLLDRLDFLAPDDALIANTVHLGYRGYQPIIDSLEALVPHFLWKDKPRAYYGNEYGREIGVLAESDLSTGVSFSFASDGYHEGGFFALLVVVPVIFAFIFLILDSCVGDTTLNPVGLVMLVVIERYAPETGLYGSIGLISQPLTAVIFLSYTAKYILPGIGRIFTRFHLRQLEPSLPVAPVATSDPATPA